MIIHNVEQGTDEWLRLRAGKPTASEFSKLITSTGAASKSMPGYAEQLGGELFAGQPLDAWEGNKYTDRGHEIEEEAALWYDIVKGITTDKVGFVTDDNEQYGCSPDRLVSDTGLLEIKCYPKLHIEAIRYCNKNKKMPAKNVAQTQGQMFICEREWCDLLFYHPVLPKVIIRVFPDKEIIAGLKAQLSACLAERDTVLNELQGIQEGL